MISMRHARCLRRLNKDELEWFSTRCHLYNGTSIKEHSSVMVLNTDASHTCWGVTFENQAASGRGKKGNNPSIGWNCKRFC